MHVIDIFFSHVIRAIYGLSYETFEVTGPQMVLTMKLTTYAWNVWDGRRPVEVKPPFRNQPVKTLLFSHPQIGP